MRVFNILFLAIWYLFIFYNQCLFANKCIELNCQTNSKTFFRPRSIIEEVNFFLGLNQYNYYRKYFEPNICDSKNERIHIALGTFFEKSRPSIKNNIGRFFLPGNITSDIDSNKQVAEDNSIESIITIAPERKVVGLYFNYHQDFCFLNGLWFDLKFAIYQAIHNLNAKEININIIPGECTPLGLLSSNILQFGKIPINKLKNTDFDDIEVKLGYFLNSNYNKHNYLGIYCSALFPIAAKPRSEFLFEPLIGRGHWSIGVGANAAHTFCRSERSTLTFLADFSYQYLFQAIERRSLDFKQGQLTRFMLLNTTNNTLQQILPAINLTTLNLKVIPRGIINFWSALHLHYCKLHTEVGYNFWWRESEKICFRKCQSTNFNDLGIFDENIFIPLTLNNLNLNSASHPRTLTNKIYLAFSYDIDCYRPVNIGLAGSYEFSRNINAIEQWGIWGNIEIGF